MSDYGLFLTDSGIDILLTNDDVVQDNGLQTAVLISLFSDSRATPDMIAVIDRDGDLRGYWGDVETQDSTGSLIWTIRRAKQLQKTLADARDYAQKSLAWMIEDKVADRVEVSTSYPSRGFMLIEVDIYRPNLSTPISYRFNYEWAAQQLRVYS